MLTWSFIGGNPTIQEQQILKETFLSNLHEFRKEFEENEPFVTVNLKADPNSSNFFEFTFGTGLDKMIDFIRRFQIVYPLKENV